MRFWPKADEQLGYPPFTWEEPLPISHREEVRVSCKCESCSLVRKRYSKQTGKWR